jgi:hypothetical protein
VVQSATAAAATACAEAAGVRTGGDRPQAAQGGGAEAGRARAGGEVAAARPREGGSPADGEEEGSPASVAQVAAAPEADAYARGDGGVSRALDCARRGLGRRKKENRGGVLMG